MSPCPFISSRVFVSLDCIHSNAFPFAVLFVCPPFPLRPFGFSKLLNLLSVFSGNRYNFSWGKDDCAITIRIVQKIIFIVVGFCLPKIASFQGGMEPLKKMYQKKRN